MPTVTLAALEQRIWDQCDGNTGEFSEPNVRAVINQQLSRLNVLLGLFSATIPVPGFTVANQFQYQNPTGIFIPVRVDFEGQELQRMSMDRLARAYPHWVSDVSSNIGPPAHVGVIDLQAFILHPADSYGGNLLEVTGIVPTTPLVNQNDVVQLADQWIESLVAYGKMRLLAKEANKAFADAVKAFAPFKAKIRAQSIWTSIDWRLVDLAMKQKVGNQRSPQ
jgi:hypothetical protein